MEKPSLPIAFWQNLAVNNPLGRDDITARDAQDWFDLVWPLYEQYQRRSCKPNHKLRIVNWWLRIKPEEIEKARARGLAIRRSKRVKQLTELATQAFPNTRTPLRTDLPPLKISRGRGDG